ncbi:SDR family NAD(P)-dependent oxidoreductase [Streptomyces daghestanicus]|uniref:SDR family NAD(P)-dependent oxidoreductase n=1 Tax=Streptomyces daghestanicus TaxID=66885 RepID=A0ABQ3Q3A0_9ACTN|nr:SDR family NAD(P)-dependent oxidoreductase [Streptomyces daghestanicus]GGU50850.1 hypothetical protein GCM10010259_47660 [Streptomyces daghestanicus]GHI31705.1 hypothetical protein Sdagh_34350 [Streptomyces daghestanicus]
MGLTDTRPLALVTGASGGIGQAPVRQFAEHGHDLVVNAEDQRLRTAARDLRGTGARAGAVRADLRTAEGAERLLAALEERTVEAAVRNAGGGRGGAFWAAGPSPT